MPMKSREELEETRDKVKRVFSQTLLHAILDVSIDGIVVTDENGQILMTNSAVRDLLQYTEEELLSQPFSLLLESDSQRSHAIYVRDKEALRRTSEFGEGLEVEGVKKNRSLISLMVFARPLQVDGESYYVEVLRDLTRRKQTESEIREHQKELENAVALAEQRILQQQEDLLELSTPVLEVWPHVLVMPLIGTLDSRRTEDALIKSLERIAELRAGTVIVDITGVPVVDTMVADHLMQMAAAIRLMGVNCVLTGIRPVIAKTIVRLGVDLSKIVTRRTLSEGLAFAIAQGGEEVSIWNR